MLESLSGVPFDLPLIEATIRTVEEDLMEIRPST
jgi:hypothetical protein